MGNDKKVVNQRILLDAPRQQRAVSPTARDLSPAELLRKPTQTLETILDTLDLFVRELQARAQEGAVTLRDIKALSDLVRAHSTLRATQLEEDKFARQTQSMATDADIAALLIEAVKAGGADAAHALREALAEVEGAPSITEGKEGDDDDY